MSDKIRENRIGPIVGKAGAFFTGRAGQDPRALGEVGVPQSDRLSVARGARLDKRIFGDGGVPVKGRGRSSAARGLQHLDEGLKILMGLRNQRDLSQGAATSLSRAQTHLGEARIRFEQAIRLMPEES